MVVIPVQFEDRGFAGGRAEQERLVAEAEGYFNRQYGERAFEFVLGPAVTLSHEAAWYGADTPERRDVHLADAVSEACAAVQGQMELSETVFLLYAGAGQHESGKTGDIYPQQGKTSSGISFAVAPEGRLGIFCHEFGHVLGLPDLYDSDGEQSGGTGRGLWGLSLMDEGCRGAMPPDFGAIEFELLGLGKCDTLTTGAYTLTPLLQGRRYLKALTDKQDEYFLMDARAGGLYVWHVDRSDNPAGYSPGHDEELRARDRWDYGLVNANPEHPCARPVPADPQATDARGLPFPGTGGFTSFGSDTPAPFRGWSGAAPGLALTGIRPADGGGVAFEVLQPIVLTDLSVYQDAAVLRWKVDPALTGACTVRWSARGEEETFSLQLPPDATSCTLEELQPGTRYRFSVQLAVSGRDRYSADGAFTTKVLRTGVYPYIYMNGATRNVDGSFPPGSKLPLRVFNATEVQAVEWSLDGTPIVPEADGRYTLRRSGTLRARILHTDGTTETLVKEIIVQ